MCGRYSLFTPPETLAERFDIAEPELDPRYNCAPGQDLPVIRDGEHVDGLEWGLVPEWADDDTNANINARAETITEKASFADAFAERRCLVPADGFYEWTDEGPYRVAYEDDRPFLMAGVWEAWTPAQTGLDAFGAGEPETPDPQERFAVVTVEPNDVVGDLHHRMAAIIPPDRATEWLTADTDTAQSLLEPASGDEMRAYRVSQAVNDPSNDDASLVEPV